MSLCSSTLSLFSVFDIKVFKVVACVASEYINPGVVIKLYLKSSLFPNKLN